MIVRLLPALGDDPATYDAGLVRRVILEEARRCSPAYVKTMAMALRGYLRFLTAQGACQPFHTGGCRHCHAIWPQPTWNG